MTKMQDFSPKNRGLTRDNRVLLSLPEMIDRKKSDIIFSKGFNPEFIEGRIEELNKFSNFIKEDNKRIILIHGPGGVGKTRFAIETAMQANKKEEYDVFWANTTTMENSNQWFKSIIPGRKTLLIIDEPKEKKIIEILLEQIASKKILDWKFAIITRSSKDYILEILKPNREEIVANSIELKPLDKEMIKRITLSMIQGSDKLKSSSTDKNIRNWCQTISQISGNLPIWIAVAIKLLEEKQNIYDLPKDIYGLAKAYLEEALVPSSPLYSFDETKFYQVLKAFAILQPIYIEGDPNLYEHFESLLNNIYLTPYIIRTEI